MTVLETRTLFEVANGEFDDGVTSVISVEQGGVTVTVGDEGVVAVSREQRRSGVTELGATHYESVSVAIRGLAHPGLTVHGVVD